VPVRQPYAGADFILPSGIYEFDDDVNGFPSISDISSWLYTGSDTQFPIAAG
jgi:hypothetical protein